MGRIKATVSIVLAALALAGSVATAHGVQRFLGEAATAPGRVVSLNAGGAHPEIEFRTRTGETVSFPEGGWIGGYRPGDRVTVRYRAEAPLATATIDAFGALWFWSIMFAVFAVGFGLGGWSELSSSRRRSAPASELADPR